MRTPPDGGLAAGACSRHSAAPKLGIFRVVHRFLEETKGPPLEEFRNKGDIKRWIHTMASEEWKTKVDESAVLSRTYCLSTSLGMKGYLRRAFPGRAILTRLRIDDLDLGAPDTEARTKSRNSAPCAERKRRHGSTSC